MEQVSQCTVASSKRPSDISGQVHSGNAKASKLSKSNIVPDDWEDDDELEDHDADHNKQLWDEACVPGHYFHSI